MRKKSDSHSEHGIALLLVLFALVLVSAIGLAMMFATNSETTVGTGYRQNNLAYFGARAGLEEIRDRIRANAPNPVTLPTVPIGQPNGVLYVLNPLNGEVVAPWDPSNPYFDDEICHEVNSTLIIAGSPGTLGVPCPAAATSIPTGTTWYVQPAPTAQNMPGGQVLSYKWTRINLKMNESAQPWCVLGSGNCGHLPYAPYSPGGPRADQVCYNGSNEFVLSDVRTPLDVPGLAPGLMERASLPSQLATAMAMFAGGSTGNGNSSHASATTTSGSSSSSSSTAGTSSSSSSSSSTSSSSSSSTASSSSTSTSGLSTTGTSGLSTTGTTGLSTTGTSSTSSSSSSTGSPPPACGTAAPPLPGTPIGVGAGPMSANKCSDLDSQPVYMLTTLAVAPSAASPNKATRMIQYEVAKVAIPPMPAALTVAGHDPVISGLPDSNNLTMSGTDSCASPGPPVPAIGTTTDVGLNGNTPTQQATLSRNAVIGQIPNNRYGNYTGADACGGTQPDVQNVVNTANSMYSTPQGLNAIVQDVQNVATQTFSGDYTGVPNLGTSSNPQVTVVDGNLTLSGATSGTGILLVTGTLTYSGNFSFNGLILVVGAGVMQASGGGSGNFTGGVVVAQIGNNSGCATGTNPCYTTNPTDANLLPHLGVPTVGWNGGGTNSLTFNSCNIQLGMNSASFAVIARREIIY